MRMVPMTTRSFSRSLATGVIASRTGRQKSSDSSDGLNSSDWTEPPNQQSSSSDCSKQSRATFRSDLGTDRLFLNQLEERAYFAALEDGRLGSQCAVEDEGKFAMGGRQTGARGGQVAKCATTVVGAATPRPRMSSLTMPRTAGE
jgi:hypothetical protein